MWLTLLACASSPDTGSPPSTGHVEGPSPSASGLSPSVPSDDGIEASPDFTPATRPVIVPVSHPAACPETIYAARSGASTGEPVPAELDAAVFGDGAGPIHERPQWTGDPSRSVSFLWQTDEATLATEVGIGEEAGDATVMSTVVGGSFPLGATAEDGRVHEVHVCGLVPGRTYRWRVGGGDHWSAEHLHTTAPTVGSTGPVRFAVGGDSRDGMQVFRAIMGGTAARGAEFRMLTGDAVNRGDDVAEWNAWLDAGDGFLGEAPTVSADGNHEMLSQQFLALFAQPGNEQYFSLDYANLHLVVLNDSPVTATDFEAQSAWLAADLAATSQPWKLVFHHQPAYTASVHEGNPDVLEWFVPVEEAGGVAVDFAGHNHNYERSAPLRAGKAVGDTEGTTYIVTAGAGAGLYTNYGDAPEMVVGLVTWHYLIVDVADHDLTVYAYDLTGNLLDTFHTTR